jgi:hypothetical protein
MGKNSARGGEFSPVHRKGLTEVHLRRGAVIWALVESLMVAETQVPWEEYTTMSEKMLVLWRHV